MCAGPLATQDCKKRSNSRLAASRRRVDGFSATVFVNWESLFNGGFVYAQQGSIAVTSAVRTAAYHWQKWNMSAFSPWQFGHKNLPRVSDTRISVVGGVVVTGIPTTRGVSTTLVDWSVPVGVGFVRPAVRGTWGGGEAGDWRGPLGRA